MSASSRWPLEGLTILVVDDHRDTVEMFQQFLTAAGATVFGAGGATAALAVGHTHVFDAVLVDLRMPGEGGRWFLRELRASGTPSALVPVYASTGERHAEADLPDGSRATSSNRSISTRWSARSRSCRGGRDDARSVVFPRHRPRRMSSS